jgi:hypothetical protein
MSLTPCGKITLACTLERGGLVEKCSWMQASVLTRIY